MLIQEVANNIKMLYINIVAGYVNNHSGHYSRETQNIIKELLINKEAGKSFIRLIEHSWDIESLLNSFDPEIIDGEFIHCVDELLHTCEFENWIIEIILQNLTYKIYKIEGKKEYADDYVSQYKDTFKNWERNSKKIINRNSEDSKLFTAYKKLSNPDIPVCTKYDVAELLATHIDFLNQFDITPFIEVVSSFFDQLNLDRESIRRNSGNSFSFTYGLWNVPIYVLALHKLGQLDILRNYRILLAKLLPLVCWRHNNDPSTIKSAYKETISSLSEEEKKGLIEWWKSREDDFINISYRDILNCITEYGIDTFSYKLEDYIQAYVEAPVIDNFLAAKDSLDLIAQGYRKWNLDQYESLFNSLKEEAEEDYYGINEIKLDCNAIMIRKFQDINAIKWRIDYLRRHIFKSVTHNAGHVRSISEREIEVTSANPYMFRCFMGIANNSCLDKEMKKLFEFGLSLSKDRETREYSNYLLKQIYFFYISTGSVNDFQILRKMVYGISEENIPSYVFDLMNQAEISFMKQNNVPITKALHLYNHSLEHPYLEIRNDGDLCRYFDKILLEVQREIQDVGIYSLFQPENINEDFIQRTLKNTIISVGLKLGLELRLDREVTLQDNKRTDILLWCGMCNPIMIELKLLNNPEIQCNRHRVKYKEKFVQYMVATRPCMAVYWVFNVHKPKSNPAKFLELESEYSKLPQTRVILTDCKCSYDQEEPVSVKDRKNNIAVR